MDQEEHKKNGVSIFFLPDAAAAADAEETNLLLCCCWLQKTVFHPLGGRLSAGHHDTRFTLEFFFPLGDRGALLLLASFFFTRMSIGLHAWYMGRARRVKLSEVLPS